MHRIGLVGAGGMGRLHSFNYKALDGVKIERIYDIDVDAAQKLARELDLPPDTVVSSIDEMLSESSVDVVSICTPTPWHADYIIAAARAGKHIFCEKPIARSAEDAVKAVDVCRESGVRLMIGHVLRFFPEYVSAKMSIDKGTIGRPGILRTSRIGAFPRATQDWYSNFDWSGGALLDLVIHDVDWCCWCLGKPVRVYAKGLMFSGYDHMDYSLMTVRFASGAIAHIEGSWAYSGPFTTKFEVAGSSGLIENTSCNAVPLRLQLNAQDAGSGQGVSVPESPLFESPYLLEDRHFFRCLHSGEPFLVSPEDAVLAVEVSLAAIESVRTGRPIEL